MMIRFADISVLRSFCKRCIPVFWAFVTLLTMPSLALAGTYQIDNDVDWSNLSPQPTSADTVYIYNNGKLEINVKDAECAAMYIGYVSGSKHADGTLEFKGKSSSLTVYSAKGVILGSNNGKGELDMKHGGSLITPSITVLNSAGKFKSGKGTLILTGNNTLPVEFTKYEHLIISTGTTVLSADIKVKGDLTIYGTLDVSSSNFQISIQRDWINSGTFVQRLGDVRFTGGHEQVITGDSTTVFNTLELNKKGNKKGKQKGNQHGVILAISILVQGEFKLIQGILYTDSVHYVTLGPSAISLGGSDQSYVNGRIKIETDTIRTIVITTGKNGKLKKAVINTYSTDSSEFFVEYFDQPHFNSDSIGSGITHICQQQYWELTRIRGNVAADLSLFWDDDRCGPMDLFPALKVARYDTLQWSSVGANLVSGTAQKGSVTSDTLTSYGCFTFGCSHGSLRTSGDYDNFSSGESSEEVEELEESPLTQIEIEQNTKVPVYDPNMVILPNPSHGKVNVTLKGDRGEEVLIVVNDLLGRTHYSKVILLENDDYEFAIDPSDKLAAGIYMVVGSSKNRLYKRKIVIQ